MMLIQIPTHKILFLVPILSQMNPINLITLYYLHPIINLPPTRSAALFKAKLFLYFFSPCVPHALSFTSLHFIALNVNNNAVFK